MDIDYDNNLDAQAKRIVFKMLDLNYHTRLSISEVLNCHPFKDKSCSFNKEVILRKM